MKFAALVLAFWLSTTGALADNPILKLELKPEDTIMAPRPAITRPNRHPSFAMKHPKLHKIGRKTRKVFQVIGPVFRVLANGSSIATPFIPGRH